MFGKKVQNLI